MKNVRNIGRDKIALWVIAFIGILLVTALVFAFCLDKNCTDEQCNSNMLNRYFDMVIPVVSAWVGAIIAFYFGKDNFQAASEEIRKLTNTVTTGAGLATAALKDMMIPKASIVAWTLKPQEDPKLLELYNFLRQNNNMTRLPIFNEAGQALYVVGKRILLEQLYASGEDVALMAKEETKSATLSGLIGEALKYDNTSGQPFGYKGSRGFSLVSVNVTATEARKAMLSVEDCENVFVTESGASTDKVIGWLTDRKLLDI